MRLGKDVWYMIDRYMHWANMVIVHKQMFKWLSWEEDASVYKLRKYNYFYAFNWRNMSDPIHYHNIYHVPLKASENVNYVTGRLPDNYVYSGCPKRIRR